MSGRVYHWIRQETRPDFKMDYPLDEKPSLVLQDLGLREVSGPARYENGQFIVLDTVAPDLEFSVIRVNDNGSLSEMRRVPLDKYEAIRLADEYAEAEEQHQMP